LLVPTKLTHPLPECHVDPGNPDNTGEQVGGTRGDLLSLLGLCSFLFWHCASAALPQKHLKLVLDAVFYFSNQALSPCPRVWRLVRAFSVFSPNIVVLLHLFKPRAHSFTTESLNLYVGTQTACVDSSCSVHPGRAMDMNVYFLT
jgi:hypothetical protein